MGKLAIFKCKTAEEASGKLQGAERDAYRAGFHDGLSQTRSYIPDDPLKPAVITFSNGVRVRMSADGGYLVVDTKQKCTTLYDGSSVMLDE